MMEYRHDGRTVLYTYRSRHRQKHNNGPYRESGLFPASRTLVAPDPEAQYRDREVISSCTSTMQRKWIFVYHSRVNRGGVHLLVLPTRGLRQATCQQRPVKLGGGIDLLFRLQNTPAVDRRLQWSFSDQQGYGCVSRSTEHAAGAFSHLRRHYSDSLPVESTTELGSWSRKSYITESFSTLDV
jgi:hypothetical protein